MDVEGPRLHGRPCEGWLALSSICRFVRLGRTTPKLGGGLSVTSGEPIALRLVGSVWAAWAVTDSDMLKPGSKCENRGQSPRRAAAGWDPASHRMRDRGRCCTDPALDPGSAAQTVHDHVPHFLASIEAPNRKQEKATNPPATSSDARSRCENDLGSCSARRSPVSSAMPPMPV